MLLDKFTHLVKNPGLDQHDVPIFYASARDRKVPLLKTLLSNKCKNDCQFCEFRSSRNIHRENWEPEELAKVTYELWKKKRIEGLFLSSSVDGEPEKTVEKQLQCVECLRNLGFKSYIHLRLMPGCSRDAIKQAAELANRIGINIEFPKKSYYEEMKIGVEDFRNDVIRRIRWISKEVERQNKSLKEKLLCEKVDIREPFFNKDFCSQIVVGATSESDKEILKISQWLYDIGARRVYYSPFQPIKGTPLENLSAEKKWRVIRLYQSSFLIRDYGFKAGDFILHNGFLPNEDPKLLLAEKTQLRIDINKADFDQLIRIPGIGIKTAKRILSGDKKIPKRARMFIRGREEKQMSLLG